MSYARWNHQSDVYVYEGGSADRPEWVTHVASNRVVFRSPLPPEVPCDPTDEVLWSAWCDRQTVMRQLLQEADHVPLNLPHDGKTFTDDSPQECTDTLLMLRAAGYQIPQFAVDSLLEEAAPESSPTAAVRPRENWR
jgi:hypothetical protein